MERNVNQSEDTLLTKKEYNFKASGFKYTNEKKRKKIERKKKQKRRKKKKMKEKKKKKKKKERKKHACLMTLQNM